MEVIVRMAEEKFFKHNLASSLYQSVQLMMENHILPEFNKFDS
jgi:hypothetical protein